MDDKKIKYRSDLASKCQDIASNMTYNDREIEAAAKHILREASHALDSCSIRVHKKSDGLLIINARGKSRYMTMKERLAYFLIGDTEIRP